MSYSGKIIQISDSMNLGLNQDFMQMHLNSTKFTEETLKKISIDHIILTYKT